MLRWTQFAIRFLTLPALMFSFDVRYGQIDSLCVNLHYSRLQLGLDAGSLKDVLLQHLGEMVTWCLLSRSVEPPEVGCSGLQCWCSLGCGGPNARTGGRAATSRACARADVPLGPCWGDCASWIWCEWYGEMMPKDAKADQQKTWRQGLNRGHRGQRRNVQRSLKGLLCDVQLLHGATM